MPERAERVALVHDWLTGMRGGEKVLEAIAAEYPGAPIHTLFHHPGTVSPALESHPIRASYLQHAPFSRRGYRRYLPFFPAAIEAFELSDYELVVSTSHCVAKGVIPGPDAYHLCYCHTPMRYAWDQEHVYFPRRSGLVARLRGAALHRLRIWDVASSPRVDCFVANSNFVARRIRRYYGRDARVVPPPVDVEFFTPADGEPTRDYVLMVSALAPYKRVDLAIAACRRLGLELRVVGTGPEESRLRAVADSSVRLLGRVEGDRLRELYRNALCFVQPGIEDFGIAAVESLACGTPVVALGLGGVLDIVEHGEHGWLYREGEAPEALVAAIDKIRQIRFNTLNSRRRAETFATARFTERMRLLLEERPSDLGGGSL